MRNLLIAALAAASFGLIDATPAAADWRAAIHGQGYYREDNKPTPQRANRTARNASEARSRRSTRTATAAPARAERRRTASSSSPRVSSGGSSGLASYYWQGQRVASGGWFNPNAMTAAHKTLPFGTRVRVTNANNGRSVDVTINDRGPFIAGRIIDLSSAAAGAINMKSAGVVPVRMTVLGR